MDDTQNNIERHTVTQPSWLSKLLEGIPSCMSQRGIIFPWRFAWWHPKTHAEAPNHWLILFFPAKGEIKEAGPHDGSSIACNFDADVLQLVALFDRVTELSWLTAQNINPELRIKGVVEDQPVDLRLLSLATEDSPTTLVADTQNGVVRMVESEVGVSPQE